MKARAINEYFNEVVYYGGLPMRWGDVLICLEKTAKKIRPDNHIPLRDAAMMGLRLANEHHPVPPDTEPFTLEEFYQIMGIE